MNTKAMFQLTYGLFVVTTNVDGKDYGCIINTAVQVANPNKIAIAINKSNYTHDMVMKSQNYTVSVLSEDADFSVFKHFGFQSGRDVDKFADYTDVERTPGGTYRLNKGANAYLSVKVETCVDLGSHTMFIGEAVDMDVLSNVPSMTYAYYHANVKPKPQPKKAAGKWVCKICGYEYEGDVLPEDFVCPLCKHPASDFEYVPAEEPKKKTSKWVCKICGYVYEGEELPEDYVCPLCKHPASDFEKVE